MRTLEALEQEWDEIVNDPEAHRTLARWQTHHPALRDTETLEDVLARRRQPGSEQSVLAALAELARSEQLAARTLLQALLPGLFTLARRTAGDDPEAIEEMVALAWERIRTYPSHRSGSVPANILFDVRKRYRRHRRIEAPTTTELLPSAPADRAPSPEEVVVGRAVFDELTDARRRGVVSETALRVIIRTRIDGEPLVDVAADERLSSHACNLRRWRAERHLRPCLAEVA